MLRNLFLTVGLLLAVPAWADTNIPEGPKVAPSDAQCFTIEAFHARYPQSDFKQFTPEQFKFIQDKFASLGNAVPENVKTINLSYAVDDPNVVILLAFDKDGCFVTRSKMSLEQFAEMLGGLPKEKSNSFDYDSSKPNGVSDGA